MKKTEFIFLILIGLFYSEYISLQGITSPLILDGNTIAKGYLWEDLNVTVAKFGDINGDGSSEVIFTETRIPPKQNPSEIVQNIPRHIVIYDIPLGFPGSFGYIESFEGIALSSAHPHNFNHVELVFNTEIGDLEYYGGSIFTADTSGVYKITPNQFSFTNLTYSVPLKQNSNTGGFSVTFYPYGSASQICDKGDCVSSDSFSKPPMLLEILEWNGREYFIMQFEKEQNPAQFGLTGNHSYLTYISEYPLSSNFLSSASVLSLEDTPKSEAGDVGICSFYFGTDLIETLIIGAPSYSDSGMVYMLQELPSGYISMRSVSPFGMPVLPEHSSNQRFGASISNNQEKCYICAPGTNAVLKQDFDGTEWISSLPGYGEYCTEIINVENKMYVLAGGKTLNAGIIIHDDSFDVSQQASFSLNFLGMDSEQNRAVVWGDPGLLYYSFDDSQQTICVSGLACEEDSDCGLGYCLSDSVTSCTCTVGGYPDSDEIYNLFLNHMSYFGHTGSLTEYSDYFIYSFDQCSVDQEDACNSFRNNLIANIPTLTAVYFESDVSTSVCTCPSCDVKTNVGEVSSGDTVNLIIEWSSGFEAASITASACADPVSVSYDSLQTSATVPISINECSADEIVFTVVLTNVDQTCLDTVSISTTDYCFGTFVESCEEITSQTVCEASYTEVTSLTVGDISCRQCIYTDQCFTGPNCDCVDRDACEIIYISESTVLDRDYYNTIFVIVEDFVDFDGNGHTIYAGECYDRIAISNWYSLEHYRDPSSMTEIGLPSPDNIATNNIVIHNVNIRGFYAGVGVWLKEAEDSIVYETDIEEVVMGIVFTDSSTNNAVTENDVRECSAYSGIVSNRYSTMPSFQTSSTSKMVYTDSKTGETKPIIVHTPFTLGYMAHDDEGVVNYRLNQFVIGESEVDDTNPVVVGEDPDSGSGTLPSPTPISPIEEPEIVEHPVGACIVVLGDPYSPYALGSIISSNNVADGDIGIIFGALEKAAVNENEISDTHAGMIMFYTIDNTVYGNYFENKKASALDFNGVSYDFGELTLIGYSNSHQIFGNRFSGEGHGKAILLTDIVLGETNFPAQNNGNYVYMNIISNYEYGVYSKDSNTNSFTDNIICGNTVDVHFESGTGSSGSNTCNVLTGFGSNTVDCANGDCGLPGCELNTPPSILVSMAGTDCPGQNMICQVNIIDDDEIVMFNMSLYENGELIAVLPEQTLTLSDSTGVYAWNTFYSSSADNEYFCKAVVEDGCHSVEDQNLPEVCDFSGCPFECVDLDNPATYTIGGITRVEECEGDCNLKIIYDTVLCTKEYYLPASSPALLIDGNNINLDCQGSVIRGDGNGEGLFINTENVSVKNCEFRNYEDGILIDSASKVVLDKNNLIDNLNGINIYQSSYVHITDNTLTDNDFGVYVSGINTGLNINNSIISQNEVHGLYFYNFKSVDEGFDLMTFSYAHIVRIINNQIINNGEFGFYASESDLLGVMFKENYLCENNGEYDVYTGSLDLSVFEGNSCRLNKKYVDGIEQNCDEICGDVDYECVNLNDPRSFVLGGVERIRETNKYEIHADTVLCRDYYDIKKPLIFMNDGLLFDMNNSVINYTVSHGERGFSHTIIDINSKVNLVIKNADEIHATSSWVEGIIGGTANNLIVDNLVISSAQGIVLFGGTNNTISNIVCDSDYLIGDGGEACVYLGIGSGSGVSDSTIDNIVSNDGSPIAIYIFGDNNKIKNANISYSQIAGVIARGSGNTIEDSLICFNGYGRETYYASPAGDIVLHNDAFSDISQTHCSDLEACHYCECGGLDFDVPIPDEWEYIPIDGNVVRDCEGYPYTAFEDNKKYRLCSDLYSEDASTLVISGAKNITIDGNGKYVENRLGSRSGGINTFAVLIEGDSEGVEIKNVELKSRHSAFPPYTLGHALKITDDAKSITIKDSNISWSVLVENNNPGEGNENVFENVKFETRGVNVEYVFTGTSHTEISGNSVFNPLEGSYPSLLVNTFADVLIKDSIVGYSLALPYTEIKDFAHVQFVNSNVNVSVIDIFFNEGGQSFNVLNLKTGLINGTAVSTNPEGLSVTFENSNVLISLEALSPFRINLKGGNSHIQNSIILYLSTKSDLVCDVYNTEFSSVEVMDTSKINTYGQTIIHDVIYFGKDLPSIDTLFSGTWKVDGPITVGTPGLTTNDFAITVYLRPAIVSESPAGISSTARYGILKYYNTTVCGVSEEACGGLYDDGCCYTQKTCKFTPAHNLGWVNMTFNFYGVPGGDVSSDIIDTALSLSPDNLTLMTFRQFNEYNHSGIEFCSQVDDVINPPETDTSEAAVLLCPEFAQTAGVCEPPSPGSWWGEQIQGSEIGEECDSTLGLECEEGECDGGYCLPSVDVGCTRIPKPFLGDRYVGKRCEGDYAVVHNECSGSSARNYECSEDDSGSCIILVETTCGEGSTCGIVGGVATCVSPGDGDSPPGGDYGPDLIG